jgi:hypothetical protein
MPIPKITMIIPELEIADDYGGQRQIGYRRSDLPLFHTVVRAPGGAAFVKVVVQDHFTNCAVCMEHGVNYQQFDAFMKRRK